MLYKFKSKVTGDIIMLEPQGRQILTIWGRDAASLEQPGILLPADIPAALEALNAAVAQDEAKRTQAARAAQEEPDNTAQPQGVSLRQRAVPLIDMLQRSLKEDKEIVWGV
jgi:thiamine pyrophosphate-dependent acetolactate synthase large subunit-like protein